jgi:hypothetical protein
MEKGGVLLPHAAVRMSTVAGVSNVLIRDLSRLMIDAHIHRTIVTDDKQNPIGNEHGSLGGVGVRRRPSLIARLPVLVPHTLAIPLA